MASVFYRTPGKGLRVESSTYCLELPLSDEDAEHLFGILVSSYSSPEVVASLLKRELIVPFMQVLRSGLLAEVPGRSIMQRQSIPNGPLDEVFPELPMDDCHLSDYADLSAAQPVELVQRRVPDQLSNLVYVSECSDATDCFAGKGLSPEAADGGALGEFIERTMAATPNRSRLITATYDSVRDMAIDPGYWVSPKYDCYSPHIPLDWIWGWSTRWKRWILVPAEMVYFRFIPNSGGKSFHVQDTNGLAYGPGLASAASAAILELFEKDAFWSVMLSRESMPDLNPADLPLDSKCMEAVNAAATTFRIHAKMITLDIPIPIVHVLLEARSNDPPVFSRGCAAASTLSRAYERAFLEAVQVFTDLQKALCTGALAEESSDFPPLVWALGSNRSDIEHLLSNERWTAPGTKETCVLSEAVASAHRSGYDIILIELGGGPWPGTVVRALSPDLQPIDPFRTRPMTRIRSLIRKGLLSRLSDLNNPYAILS